MKRIMTALLMLMAVAICALAENRIAIFEVSPKMHCENCENKIKSNLRHESGVKRIPPPPVYRGMHTARGPSRNY